MLFTIHRAVGCGLQVLNEVLSIFAALRVRKLFSIFLHAVKFHNQFWCFTFMTTNIFPSLFLTMILDASPILKLLRYVICSFISNFQEVTPACASCESNFCRNCSLRMARDINFCRVLPWETLEWRLLKRKIKCGHFSTCDGAALLLSTNVVLNRFVWKTQEAVEHEIVSCVCGGKYQYKALSFHKLINCRG